MLQSHSHTLTIVQGPQMRRQLREYRAQQTKVDLDSFDIDPPTYGAEGLDYGL